MLDILKARYILEFYHLLLVATYWSLLCIGLLYWATITAVIIDYTSANNGNTERNTRSLFYRRRRRAKPQSCLAAGFRGISYAGATALECLTSPSAAADVRGCELCACNACRMFRSKRSSLVRRLWRSRVGTTADSTPTGDSKHSASAAEAGELEKEFKSTAQSFLKRLNESQLEQLVDAVESGGVDHTDCVLFPQGEIRLGRRSVDPRVFCAQLFRWPDVEYVGELKRLQFNCQPSSDEHEKISGHVCCNPYHLSRLCRPESPPPPYSRYPVKRAQEEEETLKEGMSPDMGCRNARSEKRQADWTPASTETGNTPTERLQPYMSPTDAENESSQQPGRHWCNVAYWEHRTRVGRMYTVFNDHVDIFLELPHGNGFCLGLLHREGRSEPVLRTRTKIGPGLTLSLEDDGVWAYNRSQHALFVNSLTLNRSSPSRTFRVTRIEPGFSLNIYDFAKSRLLELDKQRESQPPDGPINTRAIQISFIKGWGPRYSRPFITSCPCWLEVILSPTPQR